MTTAQLLSLMVQSNQVQVISDLFFVHLAGVMLPFFLAFVLSHTYQKTQLNQSYSTNLIHSFFIFAVLSSVMTMVIGDNVARAFGLVGAMSIVRFRNALKSPMDAVYIFWSLAIGVCCGIGNFLLAVTATFLVAAMARALHYFRVGESSQISVLLRLEIDCTNETQTVDRIETIFREHSLSFRLINVMQNTAHNQKHYVYSIVYSKSLNHVEEKVRKVVGLSNLQTMHGSGLLHAA